MLNKGFVDEYNKKSEAIGPAFLSKEIMNVIQQDLSNLDEYKQKNDSQIPKEEYVNLSLALKGDYSKYAQLSPIFRDYAMTWHMRQLINTFKKAPSIISSGDDDAVQEDSKKKTRYQSLRDKNFRAELDRNLLNPVFQIGLEKVAEHFYKSEDISELSDIDYNEFKAAVGYMTTKVLENTLAPISNVQNENGISAEAANNIEKQSVLASTLLLGHIGGVKISDKNKTVDKDCEVTMGEILGHGGRTAIILPQYDHGQDLVNSVTGSLTNGVIYKRTLATHSMNYTRDTHAYDPHEMTFEEDKPLITDASNNYGMDPAIGGYGKKFASSNFINASAPMVVDDGKNGHMYMKIQAPKKNEKGYFLVGFENEKPGETGRYGHSHGISAKSSSVSAFGATKHCVGTDVGGRTVDLSEYDGKSLTAAVNAFKQEYKNLLMHPSEMNNKKLKYINSKLCGKPMSKKELGKVMEYLGFAKNAEAQNAFSKLNVNVLTLKDGDSEALGKELDVKYKQAQRDMIKTCQEQAKTKIVNPAYLFAKDKLKANKRGIYKLEMNSSEMKAVKKALNKVTEGDIHCDADKYFKHLLELNQAARKYAYASGKDVTNNRWNIVKDLVHMTAREIHRSHPEYSVESLLSDPKKQKSNSGLNLVNERNKPVTNKILGL